MVAEAHLYLGVALAGLVSFLSPCVLPLVPPYLGYLGGTTLDQMTAEGGLENRVWRRVVLASLFFVLGFTTVFVALGASASMVGQLIQTYRIELGMLAGVIIILFGLHFLGVLRIPLLYVEARYHADVPGASYAGAYVIGEIEETEFLAQLAVVALLGFLLAPEIFLELLRRFPGRAIDALQHLVLFIAAPICARNAHQLKRILPDLFCRLHMRTTA